jgi:two-component system repressor protein LuxO
MHRRKPRVLIVEDVPSLAESYAAFLSKEAVTADIVHTGQAAIDSLERQPASVVVLDVHLPDMNGLEILQRLKSLGAPVDVIVITSEGSVKLAVEAMRYGAFDFIMKPFNRDRLCITVRNALEHRRLSDQLADVAEEAGPEQVGRFIGNSPPMQAVYRILKSAAPTNATVFVTGESGTGKELCAEALHKLSKRREGPFVAVNCAAIPKDLLESEIFGHAKGAFTGAAADRKGAALQADGGTLFLDEVAEMDMALQSKLLRFLQEKTVQRVGEDTTRKADVRIVCATNRDPQTEVAAGRFREDLFYRLHVVPVELPPLRERDQDILIIARRFLEAFSKEDGKQFARFAPDVEALMLAHPWPGNVRQLQNVVRSIVVLHDGETVTANMPPRELGLTSSAARYAIPSSSSSPIADAAPVVAPVAAPSQPIEIRPLEDVIRAAIEQAIKQCGGSIPKAAIALDVSPSTLYRRIQGWEVADAPA